MTKNIATTNLSQSLQRKHSVCFAAYTVCKLQEILDACVKLEMKRKLVRELLVCTETARIPFSPIFLQLRCLELFLK